MTSPSFGDYQLEIYGAGLHGILPSFPMAFAELEARAGQALPPSVLSYVAGREPGVPGRGGRLPRHRGHPGHLGHRLAPA